MMRISIFRSILMGLMLCFVYTEMSAQGNSTYQEILVKDFYDQINIFSRDCYIGAKGTGNTQKTIFSYFSSEKCLVSELDFLYLDGRDKYDAVSKKIGEYLNYLEQKAKKDSLSFKWQIEKHYDTASIVIIDGISYSKRNQSEKKGYTCRAIFCFKGSGENTKISEIKFTNFKRIQWTEDGQHPELFVTNLNLAFGYKFNKCLNFSIGFNGLSDNWFIDHLKFDLEFNYLYKQEHLHYPASSDANPSQLAYNSENGDFGIGINIGYRIIPDKYGELNWGPALFSAAIGAGGIFYDKWWEYGGTAEGESHGRSAALYIKPSFCYEYLFTDFFGMGLEAGYYICPKYEPMQGLGIKVVTKFAL